VPGDAVLNANTQDGQYKLILACIYVLLGISVCKREEVDDDL
jgi:hypothetical protein